MSRLEDTLRGTNAVKAILVSLDRRQRSGLQSTRERILAMLAGLDTLIVHLPDDPPDTIIAEIDRIVTALRTADRSLTGGDRKTGIQALDLAKARILRLAENMLPRPDTDG